MVERVRVKPSLRSPATSASWAVSDACAGSSGGGWRRCASAVALPRRNLHCPEFRMVRFGVSRGVVQRVLKLSRAGDYELPDAA